MPELPRDIKFEKTIIPKITEQKSDDSHDKCKPSPTMISALIFLPEVTRHQHFFFHYINYMHRHLLRIHNRLFYMKIFGNTYKWIIAMELHALPSIVCLLLFA